MTKLTKYEEFAIRQFTCCHPLNMSYEDILKLIEINGEFEGECDCQNECEEVGIWEPFEYYDGEYVANQINSLKESLERDFIPKP